MRGADQIRNRPAVVDAPVGKGRVILFANNPIYRWQTFGEHGLVFNALLFYNDFPSAAAKPAATQQSGLAAPRLAGLVRFAHSLESLGFASP